MVGWCYSEPFESVFEAAESLNNHAPVHCDSFAKPPTVKHRVFKNIREPCTTAHSRAKHVVPKRFIRSFRERTV